MLSRLFSRFSTAMNLSKPANQLLRQAGVPLIHRSNFSTTASIMHNARQANKRVSMVLTGPGLNTFKKGDPIITKEWLTKLGGDNTYTFGNGEEPINDYDIDNFFQHIEDQKSRILLFISAHGLLNESFVSVSTADERYQLYLQNDPESATEFFTKIRKRLTDQEGKERPVDIVLAACFGGLLTHSIAQLLPKGSSFMTLSRALPLNESSVISFHQTQSASDSPTPQFNLESFILINLLKSRARFDGTLVKEDGEIIIFDELFKNTIGKPFSAEHLANINRALLPYLKQNKIQYLIQEIQSGNKALANSKKYNHALLICYTAKHKVSLRHQPLFVTAHTPKMWYECSQADAFIAQQGCTHFFAPFEHTPSQTQEALSFSKLFFQTIAHNKLASHRPLPMGFVWCGSPGMGKTSMSLALQQALEHLKVKVYFGNAMQLQTTMDFANSASKEFKDAEVIILDDFNQTASFYKLLELTIHHVTTYNKALFITSCAKLKDADSPLCDLRRKVLDIVDERHTHFADHFFIKELRGPSLSKPWWEKAGVLYTAHNTAMENGITMLSILDAKILGGFILENDYPVHAIRDVLVANQVSANNMTELHASKYFQTDINNSKEFVIFNVDAKLDTYIFKLIMHCHEHHKRLLILSKRETQFFQELNLLLEKTSRLQNTYKQLKNRIRTMMLKESVLNDLQNDKQNQRSPSYK